MVQTATAARGAGGGWSWRTLCLVFPLFLSAAFQASSFEPLPRTAPEALDIDPAAINRFLRDLDGVPGAQSVVAVHRGQVVADSDPAPPAISSQRTGPSVCNRERHSAHA